VPRSGRRWITRTRSAAISSPELFPSALI
jgi:hypothetical protein